MVEPMERMLEILSNPTLWGVAAGVALLTLPFGWWRASAARFSRAWFLAVHLPVPGVVALRLGCHLGWHPLTFVVLVAAYGSGQFAGGRLRRAWHRG